MGSRAGKTFIDERLAPLLGEFVWHSVTLDPTLSDVSEAHYREVAELLARHRADLPVQTSGA